MNEQTIIEQIQTVVVISDEAAAKAIAGTGVAPEQFTQAHIEALIEELAPAPLATTNTKLAAKPKPPKAEMVSAQPKGEAAPRDPAYEVAELKPLPVHVAPAFTQDVIEEAMRLADQLSPLDRAQQVFELGTAIAQRRNAEYAAQGITMETVQEHYTPKRAPLPDQDETHARMLAVSQGWTPEEEAAFVQTIKAARPAGQNLVNLLKAM